MITFLELFEDVEGKIYNQKSFKRTSKYTFDVLFFKSHTYKLRYNEIHYPPKQIDAILHD